MSARQALLELRVMAVDLRRGPDKAPGKSVHAIAAEVTRLADEIESDREPRMASHERQAASEALRTRDRRIETLERRVLTCPECGSVLQCPLCGHDPGPKEARC